MLEPTVSELKIGDRVLILNRIEFGPPAGAEGTVARIFADVATYPYAVDVEGYSQVGYARAELALVDRPVDPEAGAVEPRSEVVELPDSPSITEAELVQALQVPGEMGKKAAENAARTVFAIALGLRELDR